jgi:PAS domain S-box-containing protein
MNPSGNPEPFEGEYAALLRDALTDATVPSLRDFGLRLVGAGVPVSSACRLHQRALARLIAEIPGLETQRAGEILAETLSAYDDLPRAEKPPAEPLVGPPAFFRQLFEEHPFPMWVFEESSLRFLTVNQAAIEVYGYSREEFLTRTILDIRPDDDRDRVVDFIFNRSTDHPAKGEWRHRLKDGRLIDVEISSRRFLFEGSPARLVIARDITAQRQTREALAQSEERLRLAVEGAGIGTWHWDLVTNEVFWSPIYRTIFGHSPDEPAEFDTWTQQIHPEDFPEVNRTTQAAFSSADGAFRLEYRFRHSSGQWRQALARGQVHFSPTGTPLRMEGIVLDITERKQDEARLRLLEAAISNANDVVMITEGDETDPLEGKIIYVNHAFERVLGFSREEAIGNTPRMLHGPGTSEETPAAIRQALKAQQPFTAEILNYRRDGSEIWLELAIQPVRDETGRCTHWLSIQRDITDRRREEERLRHSQKMEAVGQLTAGIAHNFNNLLTVVQGNAELIGRRTPMNESLGRKKEAILTAAQRGADLVRQLMVISRGSSGAPRPLNVNALVSETGSMIERILPANIRFTLLPSEEPLFATLDAVEFSQSLLNLIVNARDAMPHGGDLTISTGHREVSESKFSRAGTVFLLDREKVRPGRFAEVVVADTGTGMTEAVRQRIFEPFFTTKPEGQGTGLGLATTLGFVAERGGFIEVTSEVGRGTIFRLLLPLSQPAQPAPAPPRHASGVFPALTVLVAEDDPAVRRLVTIILEEKGFRVLTAKDGAEAIRVATEFPEPIHLVLTDKAMPTLYGDAVIRLLSDLRPDCRFILTSGALGPADSLPPRAHFLPKPFGRDELIDAIRRVMLGLPE